MGDAQFAKLSYGVAYAAFGWNIVPTRDRTSFINGITGHGITVSVRGVETF